MLEAIKYSPAGDKVGTVQLDENVFIVNDTRSNDRKQALMYEVINMYTANQRQGTASVRTRAEVRGSTAKMYRQKGTGNARAGSRRSPVRVGGGVAFGPKPRDFYRTIPKKKKRLALRFALADKALAGKVFVIESLDFDTPNTKKALSIISKMVPAKGRKLLIVEDSNSNVLKSFFNLPDVAMDRADSVYAYEVLKSQYLILTEKALKTMSDVFGL